MSAHLDMLLTPAQLAEARAADRTPQRSTREQILMADNAALRIRCEALEARNDDLARKVALMGSELRTLKGEDALPQRGCRLVTVPFLMGSLLCEVEGDGRDELTVCNVLVNGRWLDPQDVASVMDLDNLTELVIDAEAE